MYDISSLKVKGIKESGVTVSIILNNGIRLGVSGQIDVPAAVPRFQVIPAPTEWPAGWAPEPVWILNNKEKFLDLDGNQIMSSPASTT